MKTTNIFEIIRKVTSRTEPFHSEFLAQALCDSVKGDRSLFDTVWKLVAPKDWDIPPDPKIESEKRLKDGKRIDIIILDKSGSRMLGIEVKTTKESARAGQLKEYLAGLREEYKGDMGDRYDISVSYLTPFNRERAPDFADKLQTIVIFDEFLEYCKTARHVSWLDIADIPWDGNELWQQHQAYVRKIISNYCDLNKVTTRDRSFDKFFGDYAVEGFWIAFPTSNQREVKSPVIVDLKEHGNNPRKLVEAFEFLIEDQEYVAIDAKRRNQLPYDLQKRFVESRYGEIHSAIFDLSHRYGHVWLNGRRDYGLRVAHKDHSGGVSLVRSKGERYLQVGQPR